MRLKILAILLVLVIVITIFAGPLAQKSQAVVVSTVVVGSVLAVMAMAGITLAVSAMTTQDVGDWIAEKLQEWAADMQQPLDNLISAPQIGVTVSGILVIGNQAATGISQFISWLRSELGLSNNGLKTVIEAGSIADIFSVTTAGRGQTSIGGSTIYINADQNTYCDVNLLGNARDIEFDFSSYGHNNISNGTFLCRAVTATSYEFTNLVNCSIDSNVVLPGVTGDFSCSGHAKYTQVSRITFECQIYSSCTTVLSNFVIDGDPVTGESLAVRTGTITIPAVDNDDKIFLDTGALPGDSVETVTEQVLTDVVDDTLSVQGEVAEELPEFVITGPVPVYGLKDVFPFCIPFDLYDFASCLAADPVAPHFEWRLYLEDVVDYTFVIDLQPFETVAQIFRTMFLLAFIVGLAMVTRHLMRS